jgi:hypothetical protein
MSRLLSGALGALLGPLDVHVACLLCRGRALVSGCVGRWAKASSTAAFDVREALLQDCLLVVELAFQGRALIDAAVEVDHVGGVLFDRDVAYVAEDALAELARDTR